MRFGEFQSEDTRGIVNSKLLAACKPGVRIINVARGGLLDYEAVREGLESGHVAALGLDVQWKEPWDPDDYISRHPNVVLTPHVAGVTELSYRTMADHCGRTKYGDCSSVCRLLSSSIVLFIHDSV
eukprot:jgi/Botrbrau1/8883/Bobra.0148s0003.1